MLPLNDIADAVVQEAAECFFYGGTSGEARKQLEAVAERRGVAEWNPWTLCHLLDWMNAERERKAKERALKGDLPLVDLTEEQFADVILMDMPESLTFEQSEKMIKLMCVKLGFWELDAHTLWRSVTAINRIFNNRNKQNNQINQGANRDGYSSAD